MPLLVLFLKERMSGNLIRENIGIWESFGELLA